jgi:hypothetical protein
MRTLPFVVLGAVLLPASVLALSYTDQSRMYADAPFSKPEAAAISVLTNLGAVKGNDDGTFAPGRTLNRAEFLKIALLSAGNVVIPERMTGCFPDVSTDAWFAKYVCPAKNKGMVKGYPDGKFHPERAVNYAEAIKILSELYDLPTTAQTGDEWYSAYVRTGADAGVLLPINLTYDKALTRGQMARLAAAYRAYNDGELERYRLAEQGKAPASSSISSSSSSSSISSTSSLSSRSSIASLIPSSSSAAALFPATNQFLLPGTVTPLLSDALFTSPEDADVRLVEVRLRDRVRSFSGLVLVDSTGKDVATFKLLSSDDAEERWRGEVAAGMLRLAKDVTTRLGIKAQMKTDASSGEWVEVENISVNAQGVTTLNTYVLGGASRNSPYHQTALSRLSRVTNALADTSTLALGARRKVASFTFSGSVISGNGVVLEELLFNVSMDGLTLSNWMIGGDSSIQQYGCGIESGTQQVSCTSIPESLRTANPSTTLSLFADVAAKPGATNPSLQVSLQSPGSMSAVGSIRWSDGLTRFGWLQGATPLAKGTLWSITK